MRISVVALVMLVAGDAHAFLCARTSNGESPGASLSWFSREIPFTLYARGTDDIDGTAELDILRASFDAWLDLNVPGCGIDGTTDLTFNETALGVVDRIGYDFLHPENSENLLIFRDNGWDAADANVIALTTTTYDAVSGQILDADIEFNSTQFDFSVAQPSSMDLANTAVHEIGHFLGLAHTQNENVDATMYARAVPGETKKATLACDDATALLFKYPSGEANGYCSPPTQTCGQCAPPRESSTTPIVSVAAEAADGALEGGCAAVEPGLWAWLVCLSGLRVGRSWRRGGRGVVAVVSGQRVGASFCGSARRGTTRLR